MTVAECETSAVQFVNANFFLSVSALQPDINHVNCCDYKIMMSAVAWEELLVNV